MKLMGIKVVLHLARDVVAFAKKAMTIGVLSTWANCSVLRKISAEWIEVFNEHATVTKPHIVACWVKLCKPTVLVGGFSGSVSMIHLPAPRWKFVLRRRRKARRNN